MSIRKNNREYLSIVLISIVGSLIITRFSCTSCLLDWKKYALVTFFNSMMWISMWLGNGMLASYLSRKISWVKFPMKRLVVGILVTVSYTVSIAIIIVKCWEWSLGFEFSSYNDFIIISLLITFFISLFLHGREFLLQWKLSAVDAERYQKESMQATYESLKSQVNPHFLFNSLNALTNLVYEDQDKAVKFIKQLSEVYRYVLDTRDKEVVTLSEELKFVESYKYLQHIRFGDKLHISLTIQSEMFQLAPLALQMLLENAIKHNEISEEHPLIIKVYQQGNTLVVENTLHKRSHTAEDSSRIGLDNIRKRYQFLTDQPVKVKETISQFSVSIPLLPMV
jgi:sensor histidine kinase YesM